jgi:hypothetical protein
MRGAVLNQTVVLFTYICRRWTVSAFISRTDGNPRNVIANFRTTHQPMTTGQLKTILYVTIGLCTLTGIIAFTSFDFMEVDTASNWTMKYFALPILIVMTPICYYSYLTFLRQHEKKEYKSKIWTQLRTIFRIFILTLAMTGIFFATTLSLIILTNAYFGDSKTIKINAKIVDYYTMKSRGRTGHYIKIKDQQLDRIIDLKVQGPYQIGQTFNKTMQIGKWGLLYSKK